MSRLTEDEQGFSLIELLIALTIFAVGLLGIAGLQITSIQQNSQANTRSLSTALAQGIAEEVLSLSESNPVFQSDNNNMTWDLDPGSANTYLDFPAGGRYTATWSVDSNNPSTRIARVTVTVNGPTGPNSRAMSLTCFKRFVTN